jgi:hypothetical protein
MFGAQAGSWPNPGYGIRLDSKNGKFNIERSMAGSNFSVLDGVSVSDLTTARAQWFEVRVWWGSETAGEIVATLTDESGTELESVSATDSTFLSGGIAFEAKNYTTSTADVLFDNYFIERSTEITINDSAAFGASAKTASIDVAVASNRASLSKQGSPSATSTAEASNVTAIRAKTATDASATSFVIDRPRTSASSSIEASTTTTAGERSRLGGLVTQAVNEVGIGDAPTALSSTASMTTATTATGSDVSAVDARGAFRAAGAGTMSDSSHLILRADTAGSATSSSNLVATLGSTSRRGSVATAAVGESTQLQLLSRLHAASTGEADGLYSSFTAAATATTIDRAGATEAGSVSTAAATGAIETSAANEAGGLQVDGLFGAALTATGSDVAKLSSPSEFESSATGTSDLSATLVSTSRMNARFYRVQSDVAGLSANATVYAVEAVDVNDVFQAFVSGQVPVYRFAGLITDEELVDGAVNDHDQQQFYP